MTKKWILSLSLVLLASVLHSQRKGAAWIGQAMQEKEQAIKAQVEGKVRAFEQHVKEAGGSLDSLLPGFTKLKEGLEKEGNAILPDSLKWWLPFLSPPPSPPLVLQESAVQVAFLGPAALLPFKIGRGDTLWLHIHSLRPWKIRQVLIREGDVLRKVVYGIGTKHPLSLAIPAEDSGNMTVQLSGRRLGFPVAAQVGAQQQKRALEVTWKPRSDTVYSTEQRIIQVLDTMEEVIADEVFVLPPALDITASPGLTYPINFPVVEGTVIGWAFWTGVGQSSVRAWDALQQGAFSQGSVLADFAFGKAPRLPEWRNPDLKMGFYARSAAEAFVKGRSAAPIPLRKTKGSSGYGFIQGKQGSAGLYFSVVNQSDLYDYTLYFKASLFYGVQRETMVEVQVPHVSEVLEVEWKE